MGPGQVKLKFQSPGLLVIGYNIQAGLDRTSDILIFKHGKKNYSYAFE